MPSSGCGAPRASAPAAAAAPTAPAGRRVVVIAVAIAIARRRRLLLVAFGLRLDGGGLGLGLELGGDQGVVLGAQVDLVVEVGARRAGDGLTLGREVVLALESVDLLHGHLELVGDPCVGPSLAHPGADLVQVWA